MRNGIEIIKRFYLRKLNNDRIDIKYKGISMLFNYNNPTNCHFHKIICDNAYNILLFKYDSEQ